MKVKHGVLEFVGFLLMIVSLMAGTIVATPFYYFMWFGWVFILIDLLIPSNNVY